MPADRLIHPSAWNWNSANFAFWAFSEVRYTLATLRNTKDTLFGGCGRTHDLGTVHHKSGQRLRIASRRRWAPKGAREASGATDCRITISYEAPKGRKGLSDRYSLSGSYLTHPPLYQGSHTQRGRMDDETHYAVGVDGSDGHGPNDGSHGFPSVRRWRRR
jgi:hypothetical protein